MANGVVFSKMLTSASTKDLVSGNSHMSPRPTMTATLTDIHGNRCSYAVGCLNQQRDFQDKPLDLSSTARVQLQARGGRLRKSPVPEWKPEQDQSPLDLTTKRQPRHIKRPRRDQDYVSGDHLDDKVSMDMVNSVDPDYKQKSVKTPQPKRYKKTVARTKKTLNKQVTSANCDIAKLSPGVLAANASGEAKPLKETGETVILGLKCRVFGCNEMLPSRDSYNRHLLYFHAKFPYHCLAVGCKKEFQIM